MTIPKLNNDGSSGTNLGGKGIEIFAVLSNPTLIIQRNGAIRITPNINRITKVMMFVRRLACLLLTLLFIRSLPCYNFIFEIFRLNNVKIKIIINITYEIG